MSFQTVRALLLLYLTAQSLALNSDGVFLLSFKYSVLKDPLCVLQSWNYDDETPCSWQGITCSSSFSRVMSLSLPNSQLLGSLPSDLGLIENLQILDLSNNSINGSLPQALFSGGNFQNLQALNLSYNNLAGNLPNGITGLINLSVIDLKSNYLSGNLPGGYRAVHVLDLSSNLFDGSLPIDFGGDSLRYMNISHNEFSGNIPTEFPGKIPINATLDFSFNNFTGQIPQSQVFMNQKTMPFNGNPGLCGKPTIKPCPVPSSPTSPPAIASIPKTSNPDTGPEPHPTKHLQTRFKPGTVIGIVIGDIAGIGILIGLIYLFMYKSKKKRNMSNDNSSSSSSESHVFTRWVCLPKRPDIQEEEEQEGNVGISGSKREEGKLVNFDGEKELEAETLLTASAYILGASGSSIVYKAVLETGITVAVRRVNYITSGVREMERRFAEEFETRVRTVAKLVHPNLVRVRGLYCGIEEKLIIYEFVPNGSLANARYNRKVGPSQCQHLTWEIRSKIARGVARGLAYLHEKKQVHGNLKPSNILLSHNFEPKISNFGREKFLLGEGGSAQNFGSKRFTASRDGIHDFVLGPSPSSIGAALSSPYRAPESLRSFKPSPKWDVYSFGVILLELLTWKANVAVLDELGQGLLGLAREDKNRAVRMADVAIRAGVEGKEDVLVSLFELGCSCVGPVPQKRPTMKEVLQVLEKYSSSSSSSSYYYSH